MKKSFQSIYIIDEPSKLFDVLNSLTIKVYNQESIQVKFVTKDPCVFLPWLNYETKFITKKVGSFIR